MVENEFYINRKFTMRVNFNLKTVGNKSQIWLTTTIDKQRARVFTKLLIEPQYWLKTTRTQIGERAKEDPAIGAVQLRYNKEVNKALKQILSYCNDYAKAITEGEIEHTKENFENYLKCKINGKDTNIKKRPLTFIQDYIERKKQMVNKTTQRKIVSGTIYNHYNALKRLQEFCNDNRLAFTWQLFDNRLEERLTAWLLGQEYSANTIASTFSIIKVWLKEAELNNIEIDKCYHSYTTKCQDVENIYLTEEEINRLYAIKFEDEAVKAVVGDKARVEETRDLFVVACWTGLRFGDWQDLSNVEIRSNDTMVVHTHKTNATVVIPMHPMVKEIFTKYGGSFPKSVDKTHCLKHIRLCAKLANINERTTLSRVKGGNTIIKDGAKYEFVMNHTARRSFATNMYLKGVPSISIMAITGHTTEDNFLKYIKVNKDEHARIVAQAFAR